MARRVLPDGMVCAFRVHPEDGRLYYSVHVWESRRALRAYLTTLETGHSLRQVIACCLWPARRRPVHIGEIHYNRQDLDQGTISHEATHAALQWARKIGLVIDSAVDATETDPDEERLCEAIGTITHQIQAVLREHKMLTT